MSFFALTLGTRVQVGADSRSSSCAAFWQKKVLQKSIYVLPVVLERRALLLQCLTVLDSDIITTYATLIFVTRVCLHTTIEKHVKIHSCDVICLIEEGN